MSAASKTPAFSRQSMASLPWRDIVLVWLLLSVVFAISSWRTLDDSFGSPDNAMRLTEVRAFLKGAPWFDPTEARLDPPSGYITHWSRLIDGALAGIIAFFQLFFSSDIAERLARTVWPLLLALPALTATMAIALRIAGEQAARTAMLGALGVLAMTPMFKPGEIDHHNMQIMLTLVMTACIVWTARSREAAIGAGISGALLLGIGLEYIYIFALGFGALALAGLFEERWRGLTALAFKVLAASILIVWMVITPVSLRWTPMCDALALNFAFPVALVGYGMGALLMIPTFPKGLRILGTFVLALSAGVMFVAFEPKCLGGPYGTLDSALFDLWLNNVEETLDLFTIFRHSAADALVQIAFPVVGLIGAFYLLFAEKQKSAFRPDFSLFLIILIFFVVAVGIFFQARITLIAMWFAVPIVAAALDRISQHQPRPETVRLLGAVVLNPFVITLLATGVGSLLTHLSPRADDITAHETYRTQVMACAKPENFAALAALPAGRILAPRDLGSALMLNTPHEVISAPYHRLGRAILFTERTLKEAPDRAEAAIRQMQITYMVDCTGYRHKGLSAETDPSLRTTLLTDQPVAWLEPVGNPGDAIRVWRVRPRSDPK